MSDKSANTSSATTTSSAITTASTTTATATEPFANEPKRTTEPCKCEEYDRWTDHAWYEMHVGSGKCTAYKPWM